MLRHTVFFLCRDTTTAEQRISMLRGLAFVQMECSTVVASDYGADILGGSSRLREVQPWKRTPRWRARTEGPPSNYDVAMHVDFDDEAGLAAYVAHPAHVAVARSNAAVTVSELTARVDWRYDGPPLTRRGLVRHSAMFVWRDDAEEAARSRALEAVRNLGDAPGVESAIVGDNVGTATTDFDWIMDVQLGDEDAARALVASPEYTDAMGAIVPATKHEWTARVTHMMRGRDQ